MNDSIVIDVKDLVDFICIRIPNIDRKIIIKILDLEEEFLTLKGVIEK